LLGRTDDAETRAEGMKEWKKVENNKYTKDMYSLKYKMQHVEYRQKIQDFYASVPEFLKPIILKNISKRYWKLLEDIDKVPQTSHSSFVGLPLEPTLITGRCCAIYCSFLILELLCYYYWRIKYHLFLLYS
jgi:hypothetical protein